jgi:hypothetical protein
MKHLKRFNESKDNFKEELREFCENNLAYLLDEGKLLVDDLFPVQAGTHQNTRNNLVRVQISFDRYKDWNDVKDHIIPFLIRLTNKYRVVAKNTEYIDVYIFTRKVSGGPEAEFKITDLIDDNVEISGIDQIRLFVEEN